MSKASTAIANEVPAWMKELLPGEERPEWMRSQFQHKAYTVVTNGQALVAMKNGKAGKPNSHMGHVGGLLELRTKGLEVKSSDLMNFLARALEKDRDLPVVPVEVIGRVVDAVLAYRFLEGIPGKTWKLDVLNKGNTLRVRSDNFTALIMGYNEIGSNLPKFERKSK